MNSSLSDSYSHIAAKGIKIGSKQTFRSDGSLLPSWDETWMTPADWFSVLSNEENLFSSRNLSAFRVMYLVNMPWKVVDKADDLAVGEAGQNGRDVMGK